MKTTNTGMSKQQAIKLLQKYDASLVLDAIQRIQEEAVARGTSNTQGGMGK